MVTTFSRLVRFAQGKSTFYGDLVESSSSSPEGPYKINKFLGNPFDGLEATGEVVQTDKLLCPLESTPIIICIGLNYKTHAKEANLAIPKYPAVFTKPADALAGPHDPVPIHPSAQSTLDYEGELAVVIGRDAKNVSEADAMSHVLGYAASNDVTARYYQLPDNSGGQFCYAKSFDGFAPLGDAIVPPPAGGGPSRITTRVNGELRQESSTDDLIFGVASIVSHLSRGTTLRRGTVIMTGTPAGVGYFRNEFLKDGDVVEVEIEGVGKVKNAMRFEKS